MGFFFNITAASANRYISSNIEPPIQSDSVIYENKSWSWWTNPLHVYDSSNNTSYSSVVNSEGEQEILSLNHSTGDVKSVVVLSGQPKDEHNTVGILVRGNHIFWATGQRSGNPYFVGKISKDLEVLEAAKDISLTSGISNGNYAAMFDMADNRTFSFFRASQQHWDFVYSNDKGDTWESKIRLISKDTNNPTGWLYILGQKITGDIIKFTGYTNAHMAEGGLNRIVAFSLNATTGEVVCNGVSYDSVFDAGWTPISYNSIPAVVELSGNEMIRLSDMCGDDNITHMAVIDFVENDFSQGNYRYIKFNHDTLEIIENIDIVAHGKDHGYSSYFGGIFFEKEDSGAWSGNLYLSREASGVWYCERYTYSNGAFTMTELVDSVEEGSDSDNSVIMRPQPPINSILGGVKVWYTKGKYFNDMFEDWNVEMIGAGNIPETINYPSALFFDNWLNDSGSDKTLSWKDWNIFRNDDAEDVSDNISAAVIPSNVTSIGGYMAATGSKNRSFGFKEVSISESINSVSWRQGHANSTAKTYFAVRIGSDWFIHQTGFTNTAVTSGANFNNAISKKEIVFGSGTGSEWFPLSFTEATELNHTETLQSLPTGNITAVGLYTLDTGVVSNTYRLDDLEIK